MKDIEVKLRRGMTQKGITDRTQDEIVEQIASFALYGFPESHAASFALIAYASAYLKCHYLAGFTAATLNNQPMGFYQPFTIIKDAQRHGLKVLPVDVTRSNWVCTLEEDRGQKSEIGDQNNPALRLGLLCVKGLREEAGRAIARARSEKPFSSLDDLHLRVPELRRDELRKLAAVGR
jgi:error-prone DNA polymerase